MGSGLTEGEHHGNELVFIVNAAHQWLAFCRSVNDTMLLMGLLAGTIWKRAGAVLLAYAVVRTHSAMENSLTFDPTETAEKLGRGDCARV